MSNQVGAAPMIAAAIILGGSVFGSAFWVTQQAPPPPQPQPRYTFSVEAKDMVMGEKLEIIYRLDGVTGNLEVCTLERLAPALVAHPSQPEWCAQGYTRKTHP